MAFKLGGRVFVHADVAVVMTPYEGANAGLPFTALACNKLAAEHGGKAITIKGNSIVPVSVVMGESEPTWSLGWDTEAISRDYQVHCGDGVARMNHDISITATRPGLQSVTWKIIQAVIEKGFGISSDVGAQMKDEFSGKNRELIMVVGGIEYNPFKLPETGVAL